MLVAAILLAGAAPVLPPRCAATEGYAASFGGRRTFVLRPDALAAVGAAVRRGDRSLAPAYAALLADADAALTAPPPSVTDKPADASTADSHRYRSIGPYWWPDPATRDGLPYVRRDGRINPDYRSARFDSARLERLATAVEALALAYYFTGRPVYADRAATYLRAWFLAPATRMTPDFALAQSVPGVAPGRAAGLIEARHFATIVEAIGLIEPAASLAAADRAGLRRWYRDFARWMTSSDLGREDAAATNNQALYYDAMLARFALFAGDPATARAVVAAFPARRIAAQIAADGSLPEEMTRTRSFSYSALAIGAMMDVADIGRCVGADLWTARSANGRSIRRAVDFLADHAAAWPGPPLAGDGNGGAYAVFLRAAAQWRDPRYALAADRLAAANAASRVRLTLPPN